MFILLYVLLVLISIALKITSMGIELSYQVYKRADSIRQKTENVMVNKALRGTKKSTKRKVKALKKGIDVPLKAVKAGTRVATRAAISTAKILIKFFRLVLSILRKIIGALSVAVLILDIIVFLLITASAYAYLYLFQ